ncbi:6,7-dimethyl-8-ribityllumazine synthase [Devosia sp. YIM 151766]|uniref:6,7-dimethyl-8-ribityllumazine synthase n=1 Tax=Devosia sp. YIM 151766 TaxID=3017325 RepID=UPI00255C61FC|nr:6,7-dimethyl-8-ribityllumazine synthase [Devosia sp. YIM 151766]WIY53996.1 6,7-dimethyl-8-ribityllumazine synthase [Devosia sp. YIM 151766]
MDSYGVRFPVPEGAGRGLHFLIVEGRAYPDIADEMKRGAIAALETAGASHEIIAVPGAMEVPVAIAMALETDNYDGFVALGCVIRGQTNHYVGVASQSIRALAELAVVDALPLGIGILTVDNEAQALIRANVNGQDRGGDAARAALVLAGIKAKLT